MERQFALFIGIVALLVAITLGFFYVNGTLFPVSPQTGGPGDVSNITFRSEPVTDENYLTFRYIPSANLTGPVTAVYQVQKDARAIISDKKIFESVTPDNPIEIVVKRSGNGTYSIIMQMTDGKGHILHKSTTDVRA